jgi:type VI protein secretion system component VasF
MANAGKDEKPEGPRIYVTLPAGARRLFDQLVARKLYGDKDAEVARYLVIAKLDELVEKGRLVERDGP